MANFFSADYWKALYFKAMGGQETAVDPNAMSGSFAGSATFTATASSTGSSAVDISGSFAGASEFSGTLTDANASGMDTHDGRPRIVVDMESLRRQWAMEDAARAARKQRDEKTAAARKQAISKALETDEPVQEGLTREQLAARLARLTEILSQPDVKLEKPKDTRKRILSVDFRQRAERKRFAEAQARARDEARRLADQIAKDIRNYDDAIILLLLAA